MAAYDGVEYDPNFFRGEEEDMFDYMKRLEASRDGGILGTAGLTTTEITDEPLGEVTQNCPVGYVWNGRSCVPSGRGGDGDSEDISPATNREKYEGMRMLLDNPALASGIRWMMPLGLGHALLSDDQIEGYVRNEQNEATKQQGFLDYILGRDGDVVQGNKELTGGTGSLVGDSKGIVEGLFADSFKGTKFDPSRYTADPNVLAAYSTTPTARQEVMGRTLSLLNQPTYQDDGSGYYREKDSGMLFSGGRDYGGWTGVNEAGDGNDWDSFGGDVARDKEQDNSWADDLGSWF